MNTTSSTPIRILVADDHPVVRDGLVAMLSLQADFEVVGEAASGSEVIEKAVALQPDILLLDLEMPGMDGVEALKRLRSTYPQVRAIVFTAYDTDERILAAIQAGAQGYLLKGAPRLEIFYAIRIVSQGGSLLQPVIASRLLQKASAPAAEASLFERLTQREKQVLTLLAQGMTNKQIAAALVISLRTVKFHVSSILKKLEVGNRAEAVRLAVEKGWSES
jgi:two-component system, NarL family, response regulator LiaR